MSKLLWLRPFHLFFLLKYYVPFVGVVGLAIFVAISAVKFGFGWLALGLLASFIAGVVIGAIARKWKDKGHILERISHALPHSV